MTDLSKPRATRERRKRVLKGATILTGINNSEVNCTIRNMHAEGAELTVAPESPVPQQFLLYVPIDGIAYRASVRWRKGNLVGVAFDGTEPKPAWHYG
ncbi:PilZ domain-containing protein [Mesorhizobium sp. NBSH29]|uniref:PilZ domain-containing protein n=1 Tax=Mesorhizobium sp. NBSH29 TaxID=2654249 RepID=UPI00189673D5|nr:PilZ domain-containing protein [Mesorhizobium sp. NBSH29]QPC88141.1 PilZ domain-containing protein [Mesorhizobium sp. NBSH29]